MFQITINEQESLQIENLEALSEWDVQEIAPRHYHVLIKNESFRFEMVEYDAETKQMQLKVNGDLFHLQIKDKMDLLLEKMGLSGLAADKVQDIKAPMPGLVLEIKVSEGQTIEKGDAVLVLEAMKMENVLKATSTAIVQKIMIEKGDAVEKNQVLIELKSME